jgi:hypothetical protein
MRCWRAPASIGQIATLAATTTSPRHWLDNHSRYPIVDMHIVVVKYARYFVARSCALT